MSAFAPRPFRFGVQTSSAPDRRSWVDLARRCEALGYSALTMPDHFTDQLAPVPALMCAADATDRLRVGALVWDNDYKHPAVLAKELATIDLLSEGRLEVGLGAGWMATDYEAVGLPYDPPGVRIDRFVEGLAVIKGCFADGAFGYHGAHYSITGYDALPKPLQRPRPPILIGGGGRRMLSIAAREADIIGINGTLTSGTTDAATIASMSAAAVDDKVAWVVEAAGSRLPDIEMNVRAFLVNVTDAREQALEQIAGFTGFTVDEVAATPFALIGPPSRLVEDLLARRERWGFSYVIVGSAEMEAFAPVVDALAGR